MMNPNDKAYEMEMDNSIFVLLNSRDCSVNRSKQKN